ncbi:PTS system sorbose-specific EIIB component [bioreactor metagenome]|uniref:PTS system sorbose-specific EIIB component n=1 Tax=bioreactor metagenome TaxID=1076179 RepID=A0A645B9E4_9ZZZZ|nr:PTS sugar transporter subunit IIB [Erysipelotrichaceae bacterium]
MKIVLSRIDERLAHGQVISSWTRQLQVSKILVIDDGLASDTFMTEVMKMAAPTGVDVEVMSVENAIHRIQEDNSNSNVMLLFKSIDYAYKLVNSGFKLERLNVGNIGSGPKRKGITKRVFMSPEEIEMAKELCHKGVYVYLQMLNSDAEVDIVKQIGL